MNCDEAFDALTDPAQQANPDLRWHLEFCPRCREMQTVLAPALALFGPETEPARPHPQEAASPTRQNRLSALMGETGHGGAKPWESQAASKPFLTPEAVLVAEQAAAKLHSSAPARVPQRAAKSWIRWAVVAATCLLLTLGTLALMSLPERPAGSGSEPLILADQCLWTERDADPAGPAANSASSRWVVLSCVSCHLEQSFD